MPALSALTKYQHVTVSAFVGEEISHDMLRRQIIPAKCIMSNQDVYFAMAMCS